MFQLGPKQIIINDPEQAKLLFYAKLAGGISNLVETDDDYQDAAAYDRLLTSPDTQDAEGAGYNPADPGTNESVSKANLLKILGFGDFEGADITEVIGAKGVAGRAQVSTVTFVIPTVVVGDEITLTFTVRSINLEGEFATHLSDYKKDYTFTLVVQAGETATTLAAKLVSDINYKSEQGYLALYTATNAAGVVTITGKSNTLSFSIAATGSAITAGNATAASAVPTVAYEGRNTYEQLKVVRLATPASVYPDAQDSVSQQIPIKGARYSSYLITKQVSRPDLSGSAMANEGPITGKFQFQLFINETTCANYITYLTKWLNANVAVRKMYTSTTAAGVLGGDTLVEAVATDDVAPFTAPLV